MRGKRQLSWALGAVALAVALAAVVRAAWLCDDVYITLRTVDNFVHGHGLRWNIDERVQSYTHPLWMLVLAVGYFFTREPYYTTLALSLLATAACLVLLGFVLPRSPIRGALALLTLASSHAFVAYSTSGLENPLTNLLLVLFALRLARGESSPERLQALTLLASLLLLDRLDYVLLVAPVLLLELAHLRSWAALRALAIGGLPVIAWELFSFVYYGSLVPNTAYAKLHHHVARANVLAQGRRWLEFTLRDDWVTCATVAAGVLVSLVDRRRRELGCALGCVAYVGYAYWIGGDFMGGRFWVAPMVLALTVIVANERSFVTWLLPPLIASSLLLTVRPIAFGGDPRARLAGQPGCWDERAQYFAELGLINVGLHARGPLHPWARWGQAEGRTVPRVVGFHAIGMFGYYAGPGLHIVDYLALADPLLARLYPVPSPQLEVGHLGRRIPDGYLESLGGTNVIRDPSLHAFYDVLSQVTRGPIWSWSRLAKAAGLVTGRYQYLLVRYERGG
jgi:arabinofuranosyltransferase